MIYAIWAKFAECFLIRAQRIVYGKNLENPPGRCFGIKIPKHFFFERPGFWKQAWLVWIRNQLVDFLKGRPLVALRSFKKEFSLSQGHLPHIFTHLEVAVLGDFGVGKTCFFQRFCENTYTSDITTNVIAPCLKKQIIKIDGSFHQLEVRDPGGLEKILDFPPSFYRGVMGAFLCFDLTNADSFDNVERWSNDLDRYLCRPCSKILIGTKADLPNQSVSTDQIHAMARLLNIPFIRISSQQNKNITAAFGMMCSMILKQEGFVESEIGYAPSLDTIKRMANYDNIQRKRIERSISLEK